MSWDPIADLKDVFNKLVRQGKSAIDSVVNSGKNAINRVVKTGLDTINNAAKEATHNIEKTASKAVHAALNTAAEAALSVMKPLIKDLIHAAAQPTGLNKSRTPASLNLKADNSSNVSFDFTIGPLSMEIDGIEHKKDDLIKYVDRPPKTRKEYKKCILTIEPSSIRFGLQGQLALVFVSSTSVGLGCGIKVSPDLKSLDALDPFFKAVGID